MAMSRRDVMKVAGVGALAAGGLAVPLSRGGGDVVAGAPSLLSNGLIPKPYRTTFAPPPVLDPVATGTDADGTWARYDIYMRAGAASFINGVQTPVWGFGGLVPGPTIKARKGVRIEAAMRNRLPAANPLSGDTFLTSTHLHGSDSLPQYDGYANDTTAPGFVKTYQWPNDQAARTMWYHDHAVHRTSHNVYGGIAAQYHLHDDAEEDLLPQGRFDVPLTISDAMFNANGSLLFDDRDHSGLWGDVILVNGRPWPVMRVQRRVYRFRVLNASISRSYRPTLFPQGPVHMVATDGGLMPASQTVTQWRHAPGERYEILVDFRQYAAGQRVELRNLSNRNNRNYANTNKIMAFDVTDETVDTTDPHAYDIPGTLVGSPVMNLREDQSIRNRRMRLKKDDVTNIWSIDERTWDDVVASRYREVFANPALGDIEIWDIENNSGGWHHPMHIHLIDFKVLSRNGKAPFAYERGPKDTVYVGEDERVRLLMKFGPHKGKYMIHCHNLPHEDSDMMVQFSVGLGPDEVDDNDQLSDPAVKDEEA